jgi:hypothetical protein
VTLEEIDKTDTNIIEPPEIEQTYRKIFQTPTHKKRQAQHEATNLTHQLI